MRPFFTIEYKIKGVTLDARDLSEINEYFEAATTAEYIYENYKVNKEEAIKLGYAVRERMNKYDESENESIDIVMKGRCAV